MYKSRYLGVGWFKWCKKTKGTWSVIRTSKGVWMINLGYLYLRFGELWRK